MCASLLELACAAYCRVLAAGGCLAPGLPLEVLSRLLASLAQSGLLTDELMLHFLTVHEYSTLALVGSLRLTDTSFAEIALRSPRVFSLNLSGCVLLSDWALSKILVTCTALQVLDISACKNVSDSAFRVLDEEPRALQALEQLNVAQCPHITDITIFALGMPSPQPLLHRVEASLRCPALRTFSSGGMKHLSTDVFRVLSESCPQLRDLSLRGCNRLNSDTLEAFARLSTQLRAVSLSGCYLLSPEAVETLVRANPGLQVLSIRECNQLRDETVQVIAAECRELSFLDLSWVAISAEGLRTLAAAPCARTLQTLHLSWCNLLGDEHFAESIAHFTALTDLDLSWRTCSDASLRSIVRHLPQLQVLDVSGCGEVSADGFAAFGESGVQHTQLTSLVLSWCRGLSDWNLACIARSCPNLETLDVSLCSNITDDGVLALAQCRRLRRLLLSRNKQITDKGAAVLLRCRRLHVLNLADTSISSAALAAHLSVLHELRVLVLSGCRHIQDEVVLALAEHARELRVLSLSGCEHVTDAALIALVEARGPLLRALKLCETQVTGATLLALASSAPCLTDLDLSYCRGPFSLESFTLLARTTRALAAFAATSVACITSAHVSALLTQCEVLESLAVANCVRLTSDFFADVWLYAHNLTSLDVAQCPLVRAEDFPMLLKLASSLKVKGLPADLAQLNGAD